MQSELSKSLLEKDKDEEDPDPKKNPNLPLKNTPTNLALKNSNNLRKILTLLEIQMLFNIFIFTAVLALTLSAIDIRLGAYLGCLCLGLGLLFRNALERRFL